MSATRKVYQREQDSWKQDVISERFNEKLDYSDNKSIGRKSKHSKSGIFSRSNLNRENLDALSRKSKLSNISGRQLSQNRPKSCGSRSILTSGKIRAYKKNIEN